MRAVLTEYELPVERRARAAVELTRPGGSTVTLAMSETGPGIFEVSTVAPWSGIYQARIMATGTTLRGSLFTREHLLSAAVWTGGDDPYRPPERDGSDWCDFLACLLSERILTPDLRRRLERARIDIDAIQDCLGGRCEHRRRKREIFFNSKLLVAAAPERRQVRKRTQPPPSKR